MIIFHGDNIIASRKNLHDQVSKAFSGESDKIVKIDGKKVTLEQVKQNLENSSLFGERNILVIENFFSRPKSSELTQIVEYLKNHQSAAILLWEGKKLSPTQIKLFPKSQVIEAKISRQAYQFLENLGNDLAVSLKQLHQSLDQESAGSLHYALSSHVRTLLTLAETGSSLPSWRKSKLVSQRNYLNQKALLWLHQELLEIDYQTKTGRNALDLAGELELIIIGLYHKEAHANR